MAVPGVGRSRLAVRDLLSPGSGPPLRSVVSETGWYPLAIITSLNVVDELDRAVLAVFGPNIKRYFGIGDAELGLIVGLSVLAIVLLAVPIGFLGTKVDRPRILRVSAGVWSLFSLATAFAVTLPLLMLARVGTGIGKSSVEPVGRSLLTDYYPPNTWNRVLAIHSAANPLGALLGPALAALLSLFVAGDGIWRPAFVLLTIPSVIVLFLSRRLREPPNQTVRSVTGSMITVTGAPSGMSFRQAVTRLLGIRTFRRQVVGIGVLGFALVGVLAFFNVFLEDQFGVGDTGRGLIGMFIATSSLIGTIIGGNVGERIFEASPRRAMHLVGTSIALFSVALGGGVFIPNLAVFVLFTWVAVFMISIGMAPLYAAMSAISPPRLRPLMFALMGVCIALFGGVAGGVIVGAISDATNIQIGLATLAPTGIIGGVLMARGASTIDDDIARVAAELGDDGPLFDIT